MATATGSRYVAFLCVGSVLASTGLIIMNKTIVQFYSFHYGAQYGAHRRRRPSAPDAVRARVDAQCCASPPATSRSPR